jgi:hypothetical protein
MVSEANGKTITFEDCAFNPEREKLAQNLTEYLKLQKDGYVLNVDGEWGSGKTFFLKAWQHKLSTDNLTCFIDAWNIDYLNDPLITIASKLLDTLHNNPKRINPAREKLVFNRLYRVISAASHLSSSAISEAISPIAGKTLEAGTNLMDSWLLSSGKSEYDLFRKSEAALSEFKKTLQNHINDILSQYDKEALLYIFVDELDRCRPNYAIELLESVKHLFCLKNTVFVVATNRSEMEKSIQKVYGTGFKSDGYLSRFFDRSISIRSPSKVSFLKNSMKLKIILEKIDNVCIKRDAISPYDFLSSAFSEHNLELREIEKILDQLTLATSELKERIFSFYALTYLFILKNSFHSEFHSLRPKYPEDITTLNEKPDESRFSNKIISAPKLTMKFNDTSYSLKDMLNAEFKFQAALSVLSTNQGLSLWKYFKHNDAGRQQPAARHKEAITNIGNELTRVTRREDSSSKVIDLTELFDLVDASSALE